MTSDKTSAEYTHEEYLAILEACRILPPTQNSYLVTDYVDNLLLTVLDFQMQTRTVQKAMGYFKGNVQKEVSTHYELKSLLMEYEDTKEGNIALAQHLWGYRLWTRAGMLRRLVEFFESIGVTDQTALTEWASKAEFKDFSGKVKGLGFAVFQWLVMRQGRETIKPDVHVNRFVALVAGRLLPEQANVQVLERVAKELGLKAYELDWRIWEKGRSKN